MDQGRYGRGSPLAEAAAIDIAIEYTAEYVERGGVGAVDLCNAIYTAGIDIAEGRTTVDVGIEGGVAGVVNLTHRHKDVTGNICRRTVAAAEDHGRLGAGTHLTAEELDGGVAAHGAAGVTSAVDTVGDAATREGHLGVGADTCRITAAIDVAHIAGQGIVVVIGYRGAAGHSCSVAAAEDGAGDDGTVRSIVVTDSHSRGAGDNGCKTFAAAEDDTVYKVTHSAVFDIHGGATGIGRQVTGAEDAVDGQGAETTLILDVDGNGAADSAVDVAATKGAADGAALEIQQNIACDIGRFPGSALRATEHTTDGTALNIEGDITVNIGFVGAAIDVSEGAGAAPDGGGDVGGDVHHVGAAKEVGDLFIAGAAVVDVDID